MARLAVDCLPNVGKYIRCIQFRTIGTRMTENTPGTRIRARRKQLGLTQSALAQRVGLTKAAVSQWENDESEVSGRNLVKLAAALETVESNIFSENATFSVPTMPIDAGRVAQVLELMAKLPDRDRSRLSIEASAKLFVYLYSCDITKFDRINLLALIDLAT